MQHTNVANYTQLVFNDDTHKDRKTARVNIGNSNGSLASNVNLENSVEIVWWKYEGMRTQHFLFSHPQQANNHTIGRKTDIGEKLPTSDICIFKFAFQLFLIPTNVHSL